ncbi:hypothetical protein [Paraburkholderia caffeinilytica]|uniref:hypothetical protein n=1 Tax=Paraburkholderia caffeinilytica TaxID=1761016 RepID=UPI0013BEAB3C|nr:hypothetical protein [Paraburkholderia caffeinilytica]
MDFSKYRTTKQIRAPAPRRALSRQLQSGSDSFRQVRKGLIEFNAGSTRSNADEQDMPNRKSGNPYIKPDCDRAVYPDRRRQFLGRHTISDVSIPKETT